MCRHGQGEGDKPRAGEGAVDELRDDAFDDRFLAYEDDLSTRRYEYQAHKDQIRGA